MSFWIRLRAPRVRCALTRRDTSHPSASSVAAVEPRRVLAEEPPPACRRQPLPQLVQLRHVARAVIAVRVVGGPEEAVIADLLDDGRERALVGIGRDPALPADVGARPLAQR